MIKTVLFTIAATLCSLALFAQSDFGGVRGTVVNRAGRVPIAGAELTLSQGGEVFAAVKSDAEGKFLVEGLSNGIYDISVICLLQCM